MIMGVIMITFASCGGGNGHSKAYNEAKKVLDGVMEEVNKANTCDDIDVAAFGVLGLLAVDGIDKLNEADGLVSGAVHTTGEADQKALDELTEQISKTVEEKKAALDCKDDFWFDDEEEDTPVDEEQPAEAE